ncbi:hypothetical protein OI71_12410 [Aeromonas hydrophila]|nr:hypothetical protein OI71_12410 [Aeromonas hydrophila]
MTGWPLATSLNTRTAWYPARPISKWLALNTCHRLAKAVARSGPNAGTSAKPINRKCGTP